jgi:5'-3' exonuclease
MRYLIVDTANTFFRARHSAHRQSDAWDKVGFAIHVTLASVNKAWRDQRADHVVFCFEGRSWRKDFYEPYKKNRSVARAALTESQQEEDKLFWEAFDDLKTFLTDKTNCTVLQQSTLEADDLIAGWVQNHPGDHHTIISTDTDFYQLLAENVNQYNGVAEELHTLAGIFDKKGNMVIDNKTKEPKKIPDPKFILFEKCIRGDSTDFVFSAYPGVRQKGTKSKVGLVDAYEDMKNQGFNWNNFMLQRWTDHNNVEHRVLDDYHRNRTLIDLAAQPEQVRVCIDNTIADHKKCLNRPMVGAQFLKFCGKYELKRLSDNASAFGELLGAGYPE